MKTERGKDRIKILNAEMDKKIPKDNPNRLQLACGQCIGCRLEYSRQWANRCVLEASDWECNYFLTLTYDNENLPLKSVLDKETGEIIETPTLYPEHLKKFMKDLRRYYDYHYAHDNIRFFACGEYGETGERPHYHVLLFNMPITDLVPYAKNHLGQTRYQSEDIRKIWGKGYIDIGGVTWESSAYVARYILKKQKGETKEEAYRFKEPEFTRMSRMPGIARKYYDENKYKMYELDEILINKTGGKVQSVKPARYYDRLFDIEYPEQMELIKNQRKEVAIETEKNTLSNTTLSKEEYNELKERKKIESIKNLKRGIESDI